MITMGARCSFLLTSAVCSVSREVVPAVHLQMKFDHAPVPIPPRVRLDEVLVRGRTTKDDAERGLGRWRPDLHCAWGGAVPVVRKSTGDSASVWDWYVDRPSPLFIPPGYLVASFRGDSLRAWHLEQTYPGGRE